MTENTKIEWADHINPAATGRLLGAYKSAAKKVGCSLTEWMERRLAGLRHCFTCRTWKSAAAFTVDRSRLGGLAARCKPCMSTASTASRYGLSVDDLAAFRRKHNERCGICMATENLHIDHNHSTGELRGLLCPNCNSAIGKLREDPALFAAALTYLARSGSRLLDGFEHNGFPEAK